MVIPMLGSENQVYFCLQEVLDRFVDKHFRGACFIAEPPGKKTTKYDLAEFQFDMANIDTQIVDEFSLVVP